MDSDEVLSLLKQVAADVITPRFRSLADGEVMEKKPGDLVTVADREAETAITAELVAAYPDAVVLGEEAAAADPGLIDRFRAASHGFTVDPVDGTKNFVHGNPDHAVMVAEVRGGETVRGWIWQPEHEVGWIAEKGAGVYRDGVRMHRAPVPDKPGRPVGSTSIWSLRGHVLDDLPPLGPSWVCCGVDYPRLIEGATDYLLYSGTHAWDHAPGTLMVAEAGGASGHPDGTAYRPLADPPGLVVAADRVTLACVQRRVGPVFARR
ncbi:Inositol monophosphatase family protein [Nostocoides japonicum T1-X7]|uniref:Inositol monophosphatase family protein n=1 Tax=Nostocoides japonicum T1-X7 TaxID=1194083 RepID=A0A077M0N4_9MICO|nr:inositol monophosphatase family protein [Tetrasphaera japonica]CCH79401.1 Inositol monophosphatase family protein [Tetrasphaera japonica T1-X7]CCH79441.1 Inositol monophosphatase family protein [Tetrasphaera japonica T1-X7]